jgi:hypothetical protein
MKRFPFVIFSLIALPFFGMTQEIKVSSGIGYAIVDDINSDQKKLVLCKELATCFEVPIRSRLLYLDLSFAYRTLLFENFDSSGQSQIGKRSYIIFSTSIFRYYAVSYRSRFYWAFGANGNFLVKGENEFSLSQGWPVSSNETVFRIGIQGMVGFKTDISKVLSFSVAYLSTKDIECRIRNPNALNIEARLLLIAFRMKI